MTSSLQEISFIGSTLHENQRRCFKQRLDPLDEDCRIPAIDDPVVEA